MRNPPPLGGAIVEDTMGLLSDWGNRIESGLLTAFPVLAESDPSQWANRLLEDGVGIGSIAWHGSPHKFIRPDLSKMGTGEGAQAYGHGFYSAEARRVAEEYRDNLSGTTYRTPKGEIFDPYAADGLLNMNVRSAMNKSKGDVEVAISRAEQVIDQIPGTQGADAATTDLVRLKAIRDAGGLTTDSGNLYKMDIPDETIGKMLDWDKPLSEQSDHVKGLLAIKDDTSKIELIERYVKGSVKAGGDEKSVRKAVEEIMYGDEMNAYAWNVIESNPEPFDPNAFHSLLSDRSRSGVKRGMDLYSDLAGKGIDPKKTSKTFNYADRLEGAKYLKAENQRFKDAPMVSGKGTYAPKLRIDGDNFVVDTYDQFSKNYGQQAASEYLNSLGIPGIKYLDGNSRAAGQGSRNFVSFTPDHIEMLERNGVPMMGLLNE
jgi:hypothetical protein